MKIPRQLPQFTDYPALLVVAGRQTAIFYRVAAGLLEKLDDFQIETPQYSDNEGQFRVRGKGMTMKSGAPRELERADIIRDFLREFKKRLQDLPGDFHELWLFAPPRTKNEIQAVLPVTWRSKLKRVIPGNYSSRPPLELLAKLS